jgi:hypothetical protein
MRRGDVSGDAYKSKKAGGDMTKGPMAPYAFYSLNPAVLNRRKRHKKDDRFTGLIQHKGERVQGNKMTKSQRLARAKARANTRTKNKSWEDR